MTRSPSQANDSIEYDEITIPANAIGNPYYELFLRIQKEKPGSDLLEELSSWASRIARADFIEKGPEEAIRVALTRHFGCAIPSPDVLTYLTTLGPIVELGAGSGYWAALLKLQGVDIVAIDPGLDRWREYWTDEIVRTDGLAIQFHPDRTLLMVWPSDGAPWAADALSLFDGKQVVYIGEPRGGHMADDRFFDLLEKEWTRVKRLPMPQWPGWKDELFVYERAVVSSKPTSRENRGD